MLTFYLFVLKEKTAYFIFATSSTQLQFCSGVGLAKESLSSGQASKTLTDKSWSDSINISVEQNST